MNFLYKFFNNRYIYVFAIVFFFTFSLLLKKDEINKNIGAPNIVAPYHVLHTVNAYFKNDESQHYFLPIVTLNNDLDKFIPWGATVSDDKGNYFYTSFSSATFVLPYLYFKLTNFDLNIQNLVKLNYFLQLMSIIIMFFLLSKINFRATQNQILSNIASFISSIIIFIFSTEFMISFGLGYWAHSISLILIIVQLYILISIDQEGCTNKKLILLGLVSIIFCYTEWTGFSTTCLISFYFFYLKHKNKEYLKIFSILIISTLLGGVLIVIQYGFIIGFENLFYTLYSRFEARSADKIDYIFLLMSYIKSYGLYLFILPIFYFLLLKGINYKSKIVDHELFYLPILFSLILLIENIIMMQHAVQFSFDRLKFGILLVIFFNIFFLHFFAIKENFHITLVILFVILISVIQNINTYKNILKDYSYFEEMHSENIDFSYLINTNKSILCQNTSVRGYSNMLFNRGIYENVSNLEECMKIAKKKVNRYIFFNSRTIYPGIPEYLSAEILEIDTGSKTLIYAPKFLTAFNLSDQNWENGISIKQNGFFIKNSENIEIKKEDKLEFSTGIRNILNIQYAGPYINIFVEGEKLDSIKDGYPNKIKLIKKENK